MKKFSKCEQTSCPFQGKQFKIKNRRLTVEEVIAHGGFSVVLRVTSGNERYALKKMLVNEKDKLERCVQEININRQLNSHKNISKMIDSSIGPSQSSDIQEVLILYKLYSDTVQSKMTRCQSFSQNEVMKIFIDVCHAVAALHQSQPPIFHRDLKVENLLIDTLTNTIFLCDFGSASVVPLRASIHGMGVVEEEISKYTTLSYRSPEMVDLYQDYAIDDKSDIWALGCLLYRLCFFINAFGESALAITSCRYNIPADHHYHPHLINIIKYLLASTPDERPDIYQLCYLIHSLTNTPCPISNTRGSTVVSLEDLKKKIEDKPESKPTKLRRPEVSTGTSIKPRERPRGETTANKNDPSNLINIHTSPKILEVAKNTPDTSPNPCKNYGGVFGGVDSNSSASITSASQFFTEMAVDSISSNLIGSHVSATTSPNNLISLSSSDPFAPANQAQPFFAKQPGAVDSFANFNQSNLTSTNNNEAFDSNNPFFSNQITPNNIYKSNSSLNNIAYNNNNNNNNNKNNDNNISNNDKNNNTFKPQHLNNSLLNINAMAYPPYHMQRHRRNYSDTFMLSGNNQQQQLFLLSQHQQQQKNLQTIQNTQQFNEQQQQLDQQQSSQPQQQNQLKLQLQQLKQQQLALQQQILQQTQQNTLKSQLLKEQEKLWRLQQQQKALTPVVMMTTDQQQHVTSQQILQQNLHNQHSFNNLSQLHQQNFNNLSQLQQQNLTNLTQQQQQIDQQLQQLSLQQKKQNLLLKQQSFPSRFNTTTSITHSHSILSLYNYTNNMGQNSNISQSNAIPNNTIKNQGVIPGNMSNTSDNNTININVTIPQQITLCYDKNSQKTITNTTVPQSNTVSNTTVPQGITIPHQTLHQPFDVFGDVPFNNMVNSLKQGHKRSTSNLH